MKIEPRQQLLEIWRATARSSWQDGKWVWGGRDGTNSISDTEQLLCLMGPAAGLPAFRLDRPDETADDILRALGALGDSVEIPRLLIRVITEYMEKYTDEAGTPIFSGDSYFFTTDRTAEPTTAQRSLDVVDSFSMSITLSLATIGFIRVFRTLIRREDLRHDVDALEAMASKRLTAAMVGLLRSFTVSVFDTKSTEGRLLCRTVNQNGLTDRRIVEDLRRSLREVNASLRDVTIGSGAGQASDLDNPNRLFECGWSWGIVKDAPVVQTVEKIGQQPAGVAQAAPYLYFTGVALDGIENLFSERTRILALLDEEQLRLAQALQLRWDLTQSYWSTIATFGDGRWPLEDIPWRTTDDEESDYFSLVVTSIVVQDLVRRRATDADLNRVGLVLEELANRGRITRRPFTRSDPAIRLHAPGVPIELVGSEEAGGPPLSWVVSDFSPLLLKRSIRVAGLIRDTELRGRLLALADVVWDKHVVQRRLRDGAAQDLWDQPELVFPEVGLHHELPSWYYTERVVECLVTAANVVSSQPLRSERLAELAMDLLTEADHLFDQEQLNGSAYAGPSMRTELQRVRSTLARAREVRTNRPGSAVALAIEVLRDLDRLAAARRDVAEAS
jgi:hypothetical protein